MKKGVICEGMVKVWAVTIDGRGGDSVREEYFETKKDGVIASFRDKCNRTPEEIEVMKFSDGSLVKYMEIIHTETMPKLTDQERDSFRENLLPIQKMILEEDEC
jgi:hypothetical protein